MGFVARNHDGAVLGAAKRVVEPRIANALCY